MANERRLIERKAAIDALTQIALQVSDSKTRTVARCISAVELLPTVEVCYCEDCKHYAMWADGRAMNHCDKHDCMVYDDDFCSYGERKSGTQPQREDV